MAEESFEVIPLGLSGRAEQVDFHGVPFQVFRNAGRVEAWAGRRAELDVTVGPCRAVFLLGMTTAAAEGCEWWAQNERYHYQGARLFLGDRLGQIRFLYDDRKLEVIPIIFGVNAWPYELFEQIKPHEKGLKTYGGPSREPFASDRQARRLLEESLCLRPNDAEKGMKYVLAIRTRPVGIKKILLIKDTAREAGFAVSAATGLKAEAELPGEKRRWRLVDNDFFVRKLYFPALDRLARRFYQFRDALPANDPPAPPAGYRGPKVRFEGTGPAEIFANVYTHNLHDMATEKVDAEGGMHTSSPRAPSFGGYVGFGTHRNGVGSYYAHVWSRDVGRSLIEVTAAGYRRRPVKAGDQALRLLYDRSLRYARPNWKRIANAAELGNERLLETVSGKENDGHASMMLFIYRLFQRRCVDEHWLIQNRRAIIDAAEWFGWQMENPGESLFDRVLYSQSEASTQEFGGHDLFSNALACQALRAYARLADAMGDQKLQNRWNALAEKLWEGILACFTTEHPRYGRVFVDTTYDCWTWEAKRLAPLFLAPDLTGYDPARSQPELYELGRNTYLAQREENPSYAYGRQMGYGQGYITQAAILLDEPQDMQGFVEQAAAFAYHHTDHPYIVPEGVIMHPSGQFWFRNGDLGNSVQQAEIVKCARLLIGLDDLEPEEGLGVLPRLPGGWTALSVEDYPFIGAGPAGPVTAKAAYHYARCDGGYQLDIRFDRPIARLHARLGPFSTDADVSIEGVEAPPEVRDFHGRRFAYVQLADVTKATIKATGR